jgi:hypothetical protein
MSLASAVSTYAVGQVAITQLASRGELPAVDLESAKKAYNEAFERGKKVVSGLVNSNKETDQTVSQENVPGESLAPSNAAPAGGFNDDGNPESTDRSETDDMFERDPVRLGHAVQSRNPTLVSRTKSR